MRDPEELSREELIAVVRDQAVRLSAQAAELERLRAELEQIKRLISRNSGMPSRCGARASTGRMADWSK